MITNFKIFEGIETSKKIELKLKKHDGDYYEYTILYDSIEVGMIEFYLSHYVVEIISMTIRTKYQNKGIGAYSLKLLKKKTKAVEIKADCLSQQSFFMVVKAFGKPTSFGNIYREFDNYEDVKEYLPEFSDYDDETGDLHGGSMGAVDVRYEFDYRGKVKYDNISEKYEDGYYDENGYYVEKSNKPETYQFAYCCVAPDDKYELQYIVDNMKSISCDTFLRNVSLQQVNDNLMYNIKYHSKEQLKRDYSVSFYRIKKSNIDHYYVKDEKIDAYIIMNSGIEYIFKKIA